MVQFLSFLTLLTDISLGIYLALWLLSKFIAKRELAKIHSRITTNLSKNALKIAFIISLTATGGSLYFSEVLHYTPCILCWYQRIFMYPQVIILGVALFKKIKNVYLYSIPLSLVGATISIYNYYLQLHPNPLAPCSSIGFSVSCSERFFTYYGYITIPWMALSAFTVIILIMVLLRKSLN